MNGLRVSGQFLLWLGFLSAALAACSQKERDFLPDSEKSSLAKLVDGASISQTELENYTSKKIVELSAEELDTVCTAIAPLLKERSDKSKKLTRLTSKPVAELSPEELDEFTSFVIPILRERAEERAAAEEAKKEASYDEAAEKDKKVVKSFGRKEFTAKRTSLISNKWPTINWMWYGLSMVIGIAGVVLLRKTSRSAEMETTRVAGEFAIVTSSLAEISQRIGELKENLDKLGPQDVVDFIDETCVEPFAEFADARNALVQRYGLQPFAEIMTQFASGERFLNRVWSAAADGYMNEARDSLERSVAHITRAGELMKKYESEHSGS